jgi:PAS domain S-box-containing protein
MMPETAQAERECSDQWRMSDASRVSPHADAFDPGPAFWVSGQPMVLLDVQRADFPIVLANDAFRRLMGQSGGEAIGTEGAVLFGQDTDPACLRGMRTALQTGTGIDLEVPAHRRDGDAFECRLAVSPVRHPDGENRYALASLTDLSRLRSLEQESAEAKAALGAAKMRLRELEAELAREKVLLHEADHRIKNSLQMASSLVLLSARRVSDDAGGLLHNLAERMAALSSAHRMLERSGGSVRLDMGSLVAELAGELGGALPAGQVEVETRIEPATLAASRGAPVALLANEVIGNAFKHAFPEGRTGHLRIALSRSDGHVRLTVEDDGVGLPATGMPKGGFGRVLIDALARQLRAGVEWQDAEPGTRVTVNLPLDPDELSQ